MSKLTYTAKDISEILHVSLQTAYKILRELQRQFMNDNPDCIVITRCIPVDYFNKKILGKEKKWMALLFLKITMT